MPKVTGAFQIEEAVLSLWHSWGRIEMHSSFGGETTIIVAT
jgi:hypothetical protein